jgi:hypothetical protein
VGPPCFLVFAGGGGHGRAARHGQDGLERGVGGRLAGLVVASLVADGALDDELPAPEIGGQDGLDRDARRAFEDGQRLIGEAHPFHDRRRKDLAAEGDAGLGLEVDGRADQIIFGGLVGVDVIRRPDAQLQGQNGGLPGLQPTRGRDDCDLDDRLFLLRQDGGHESQEEAYKQGCFLHDGSLERQAIL